jgi:hypothetical protein
VIPKRMFWFVTGAASGFGGALYAYARVREVRGRLAADRLADTLSETVVGAARSVRGTLRDALDEGRQTMEETHQELERQHRPPSLDR